MAVPNVPRTAPKIAPDYPSRTLAIAMGMWWTGVGCVVEPAVHPVNIETDAEYAEEPINATVC